MIIARDSVGRMPFVAIVVTVAVCTLINVFLVVRTHLHGPSVVVQGLHRPTSLSLIHADSAYAAALAKRFALEYYNWSWVRHMVAKRRAAYLCDPTMASLILNGAQQKDRFYAKGLVTSAASPETAEVVESNPVTNRFVVQFNFVVHEWESFLPSSYTVDAQIVVEPSAVSADRGFLLWVTNYSFTPRTDPTIGAVQLSADDEVIWAQISASGRAMDQRHTVRDASGNPVMPQEAPEGADVAGDDDDASAPVEAAPSAPSSSPATPAASVTPSIPASVPAPVEKHL